MSENSPKWVDLTEDGGVKKHLIKEGRGRVPFSGEKVAVSYVMKDQNGKLIKATIVKTRTYDFVLGEEGTKGWTLAILSMKCGEFSKFEVSPEYGFGSEGHGEKVGPNEKILYEIELRFILEPLPKQKAIDEAEALNKQAGEAFKAGDFVLAIERYNRAKNAICLHNDEDVLGTMNKLNSNLSTCYSKLSRWSESLHCAENVLRTDSRNPKCLMRKVDALTKLKNVDAAKKSIEECLEITNNDPAFVAKKKEIEKLSNDIKNSTDSAFSRLAGKKFF
jgi:hypothetical protein